MEARQDWNGRFTLIGVSSVDGKTPVPIKVNPITGRVLIELPSTSMGIMPSGTIVEWQIVSFSQTDGMVVEPLTGSGYMFLTDWVPAFSITIPASAISESVARRFVSDTEKATWNGKQNALGFTPENPANKGSAWGYAPLDALWKVPTSMLPTAEWLGYTAENVANKWTANGYAGLDATGKVPASQLPAFVDDVLEYATLAGFPWTGETGKMYVALNTNKVYRWSGSAYIEISGSPWTTDAVTEWATNLYFTTARVLGTLLTGLSTATNAVITASDSVLTALGKLQKQMTDEITARASLGSTVSSLSSTVSGKADDSAVVHKAGSEDISGYKNFQWGIRMWKAVQISWDLNSLTDAWFYDGSALTNAPTSNWYYIEVQRHSNSADYVIQKAIQLDTTTLKQFIRIRYAWNWTAWSPYIVAWQENTFTGKQTISGTGKLLVIGDDSALHDVNIANTMALKGEQNPDIGRLQLGISAYIQGNADGTLTLQGLSIGAPVTSGTVSEVATTNWYSASMLCTKWVVSFTASSGSKNTYGGTVVSYSFETSPNNSTWTVVKSGTFNNQSGQSVNLTIEVENKYVRASASGGSSTYDSLSTVQYAPRA